MFTGKVNLVIKTIKDRKVGAKNMEPLFAVIAFDPCFCSIFLIHSATLLALCIFTFLFCGMCSFSFFLSVPFRMIYFSFHSPCFFFQSLFLCLLFLSFLCLRFPLLSSCSFFLLLFSCSFVFLSFSNFSFSFRSFSDLNAERNSSPVIYLFPGQRTWFPLFRLLVVSLGGWSMIEHRSWSICISPDGVEIV